MEKNCARIWAQACGYLAEKLPKDVFDRWIAVIDARALEANTLILTVANDFYQSWLEENYLPLIRQAMASVCSQELNIVFRVDAARTTPAAARPAAGAEERPALKSKTEPAFNAKYTFDSFVVGPSNSFAHAASLAVAQSPAMAYNPLFLYGGSGLGKTHLMQAIGQYVSQQQTRARVAYTSCEAFFNDYVESLQRKTSIQFRRKYRTMDVLLIDDVHFLAGKEGMQEEFFHTFNALYENRKQIVMTCDRPVNEIPGLEQRLLTRFQWGQMTQLEQPDMETRMAILCKKQEEMKVKLPNEVLLFIAEHIRSNIRSLEGALIRVTSYASLLGHIPSIEIVENQLRDILDQEQQRAITMESIQRAVAEQYDIRLGDMTSKQRPQAIAFPRQVAMYLCRDLTDHSLPAIGEAFGRNHATVLHACSLINTRMKTDPDLRQTLAVLRQRLGR
ncbi:MAG: chromosomal replication initiator protein DnaA [Kiritimatiellaeota bacterium]|nr:chromosomal replication initiator protein DnaA [Kiritimatiellota bacterium]